MLNDPTQGVTETLSQQPAALAATQSAQAATPYSPADWQDVPNTSRAVGAPTTSAHTASSAGSTTGAFAAPFDAIGAAPDVPIPLPNRGGVIRRQPFTPVRRGLALPAAAEPAGLLPENGGLSADREARIIGTRTQPPPFELEAIPHPLQNTELHAKLATYYKEPFGMSSISELENRFIAEINSKKQRRMPLDQRQIELLGEINTARTQYAAR